MVSISGRLGGYNYVLDNKASTVLLSATSFAHQFNEKFIEPEWLLLGLLYDKEVSKRFLIPLGITFNKILKKIEKKRAIKPDGLKVIKDLPNSPEAQQIINYGIEESKLFSEDEDYGYVSASHLLLGFLRLIESDTEKKLVVSQILKRYNLSFDQIQEELKRTSFVIWSKNVAKKKIEIQ